MTISLAGVAISVDDGGFNLVGEANYSLQEVLDAVTETINFYGAKSERVQLEFLLDEDRNSNTGLSTLRTARTTDANVNLTMDTGSWGNFRILSLNARRVQALNHTNTVWRCSAELIAS